MDEGGQKVTTSSYMINKSQGCHVQHDEYKEHGCMFCMKVVERANPEPSHHKKNFPSFNLMLYLYEMVDVD